MKVSDLTEILSNMNPDDDICVLLYDKSIFDYENDDDLTLTKEGWAKVCKDFDDAPFNDVYESISMAVLDYAEMSPIPNT